MRRLLEMLFLDFETARGYARLHRKWQGGDVVQLSRPMPVQRLKAHPNVEANLGRAALQRGPLVYCLEAADNGGHVPPTVRRRGKTSRVGTTRRL
jgi:DUF1680 family protein